MKKDSFLFNVSKLFVSLHNKHFLFLDIFILLVTPTIAFLLRFDNVVLAHYAMPLAVYTVYALVVRLIIFSRFGFYGRLWRYASVEEVVQLVSGILFATIVVSIFFFGLRWHPLSLCPTSLALCGLPRSVPLLDGILVLLGVGGIRFSSRLAASWLSRHHGIVPMRRVLVMGAGDAGAMIVREMRANPQLGLEPIGFVDDDMYKHDVRIHGLPVLGSRYDIPDIVQAYKVVQVIIAMPSASGKVIRDVMTICEQAGVPAKTIPGIYELLDGQVSVNQLREIDINDLLRREPVHLDTTAVHAMLRGKRVLVTGGGGSIGGELCRQIWRCNPAELIIMGHGENSIFNIFNELRVEQDEPGLSTHRSLQPVIADIRSSQRLRVVFARYRPQVVFHAAAHKHVPLMERNPAEAITNNVLGTRNVLRAALTADVERFVMISTDKAVNPTSIMGASKRVAELLVHRAAKESGKPYVAVRFGNVLGSRGSVINTFKRQIAQGGPVTVTHPEMKRYFMTIPEAVQLVLQASVLGRGGEVFVLDMGEPVRIVDLARDMIELSGLRIGEDIDIKFVGMRAGEKLFEEIFGEEETYQRTRHEKIFIAADAGRFIPFDLDASLSVLVEAARRDDKAAIVLALRHLIPEFSPVGESVVGKGREIRSADGLGNISVSHWQEMD